MKDIIEIDIPEVFETLGINKCYYFLTGPRALDDNNHKEIFSTEDSDYDYILDIHFRHYVLSFLSSKNIEVEYSCYNGGFKFWQNNKFYNVITVVDIEFKAWQDSLNILKYLINVDTSYRNAIKNKMLRYSFYEQFRGICKSMITTGVPL